MAILNGDHLPDLTKLLSTPVLKDYYSQTITHHIFSKTSRDTSTKLLRDVHTRVRHVRGSERGASEGH